ncbi:hypothetical protein ORJ66_09590 [Pseudoalteromonas tunicata]|uniref:hypothetical protein n=1 Tax=Pseudoalteromonas tunicata TaxID=314281 RepID=UPI00273EF3A4|nr:hypothetical protein [Pseudoalteromonas tunicata]MDP5213292.1 hypothetical protein [Pseudoalteromonas tunicata]
MKILPIILTALVLLLPGCKTLESVQDDLGSLTSNIMGPDATPEQIAAAFNEANKSFSIAKEQINIAENEELNAFDKTRVTEAQKLWQELEADFSKIQADKSNILSRSSLFSSQTNLQKINASSAKIFELITAATQVKDRILLVLKPVRDNFTVLNNLNTAKSFSEQFGKLNAKYQQLTGMLAQGQDVQVEAYLPTMLANQLDLEKNAVVEFYLAQVIAEIKVIANSDKASMLPSTYAQVRTLLDDSVLFAKTNNRDYQAIEMKRDEIQHHLNRIDNLYAQHQALKLVSKDLSFENYLLDIEQSLFSLTQKAGLGDKRHLTFKQQFELLKEKF